MVTNPTSLEDRQLWIDAIVEAWTNTGNIADLNLFLWSENKKSEPKKEMNRKVKHLNEQADLF